MKRLAKMYLHIQRRYKEPILIETNRKASSIARKERLFQLQSGKWSRNGWRDCNFSVPRSCRSLVWFWGAGDGPWEKKETSIKVSWAEWATINCTYKSSGGSYFPWFGPRLSYTMRTEDWVLKTGEEEEEPPRRGWRVKALIVHINFFFHDAAVTPRVNIWKK